MIGAWQIILVGNFTWDSLVSEKNWLHCKKVYRIVENSEKEKERNVANVNRKNWRKEELKMKNGEEIEVKRERNVVEAKTGATVEDAEAKAGLAVAVEIDVGAEVEAVAGIVEEEEAEVVHITEDVQGHIQDPEGSLGPGHGLGGIGAQGQELHADPGGPTLDQRDLDLDQRDMGQGITVLGHGLVDQNLVPGQSQNVLENPDQQAGRRNFLKVNQEVLLKKNLQLWKKVTKKLLNLLLMGMKNTKKGKLMILESA